MEIYNPRKERGGNHRHGREEDVPGQRPSRGLKVLAAAGWLAVAALLLLSLFGETGILQAVRQAEKRRQAEREVAALKEEIEALRVEVGRLRTSREFVREVARDGGFVGGNEVVILLDNVPSAPHPPRGGAGAPARDR